MNKFLSGAATVVAAGLLSLGVSGPASATVIVTGNSVSVTEVGDAFDVSYLCPADVNCGGGAPEFDVLGSTWWEVTEITTDSITFSIKVINDTAVANESRLGAFGVDVIVPDPTAASVVNDDTLNTEDWDALVNTTFPTFNTVDLCLFAGRNCAGGGNSGLESGEMDMLELTLSGVDFTSGATLTTFPIKYQSVGDDGISIEFAGVPSITGAPPPPGPPPPGPPPPAPPPPAPPPPAPPPPAPPPAPPGPPAPPNEMPEPASLLLFGLGILGLMWMVRRRKVA